jgi:ATP-binding cassette subfamily B protein
MWRSWEEQSGSWRESAYLADLALRPGAAKELRLFGLADWVRGRYRERWLAAVAPSWVADRRSVVAEVARLYVVGALAGAGAVALAGHAAIDGELSVGQLAVVAQSAFTVLALAQTNAYADQQLLFGMVAVPALRRFEHATAALAQAAAGAPADGMPAREIRCEGLRFAYPGSGREVLRGLDLSIRAGESLAIVGLNGAGKTTLVKLLAGLYEPTGGRIAIDGSDLAALDARAWRRRIAVIFQDFVRYELPARENIRFGALHHGGGDEAIDRVAALAGAGAPLAALPLGLDTTLARGYEGGADLSGGEWQRVALARALYAVDAGASVLVLDEPTANLDVRAEAALFDRFLELTAGVTTILISHRFSTVRHADRICVLEHGRVGEQGSHAELVAAGGRYAELFRLQAARFDDGEEEADA